MYLKMTINGNYINALKQWTLGATCIDETGYQDIVFPEKSALEFYGRGLFTPNPEPKTELEIRNVIAYNILIAWATYFQIKNTATYFLMLNDDVKTMSFSNAESYAGEKHMMKLYCELDRIFLF